MTSATAPHCFVVSALDYPDARTLADQLNGELASIDGGPTTGHDMTTGCTQPADRVVSEML